jgi:hypothetical protein
LRATPLYPVIRIPDVISGEDEENPPRVEKIDATSSFNPSIRNAGKRVLKRTGTLYPNSRAVVPVVLIL